MPGPAPRSWTRSRPWGLVAAGVGLTWLIFHVASPLGFSPTDDGFILAQSYRIIHGQVPHLDFVSPRPVGSPLLHVVDFLVPLPLLEASRLVASAEFVVAGVFFGWLIFDTPPWRWRLWQAAAVAASVLISVHRFPLLAWHTIDGIVVIAIGFVLVRRPRTAIAGLVVLGASVVIKQSFFAAPLLGAAMAHLPRGSTRVRPAARRLVMSAIPMVAYLLGVALLGALPDCLRQLSAATPVYGGRLLLALLSPLVLLPSLLFGLVVVLTRRVDHGSDPVLQSGTRWVATGLVLTAALGQTLVRGGFWGVQLLAFALVALVSSSLDRRAPDWPLIAVVSSAWMISLSWGYTNPDLMGGPLALVVVVRIWSSRPIRERTWAPMAAIGALAVTLVVFVNARDAPAYQDGRSGQLTYSLRAVAAGFGDIRTNPATGGYLAAVRACVGDRPPSSVAVLPDNAALYPLLHLHDPFPADWLLPREYAGSRSRLVGAARDLVGRDYLVLVQTQDVRNLAADGMRATTVPFSHDSVTMATLLAALRGERSTCGPFLMIRGHAGL